MDNELTNLLPPERIRAVRREYFIRLACIAIAGLTVVVLGSGALLVPSYLYLHEELNARNGRVAALDSQLTSSGSKEANARLSSLASETSYLGRLASTTSVTTTLRTVLSAPHTGITLTAFSVTPPIKGNDGKMNLTGNASTRETLRAYNDALANLPGIVGVDLPISAYAKDSNIPFSIVLTGSFTP